jgi:KDO2-lipid IV(A) lauroyltransferase
MLKQIRYALEALPAYLAYGLFAVLPLPLASRMGATLGRWLGRLLPVRRVAERNLALAMPELSDARRAAILRGMWEQLGRTLAEFPHLGRLSFQAHLKLTPSPVMDALRGTSSPVVFLAGHLSNWEVAPLAASRYGLPLVLTYRQTNNPYVNWLVEGVRRRYIPAAHRKGRGGMRHLIRALQRGKAVGMMVDQKENGGLAVPFFHAPAMTTPLPVQLARKLNAPVILARTLRDEDGCYSMEILPMPLPSGMTEADDAEVLARINRQLEVWIRERPEDWFWLHRRWPKEI